MDQSETFDQTVAIKRVAKVIKGGRRFKFTAVVVVGNGHGQVGVGLGKASEIANAIRKATEKAKRTMEKINIYGTTIPHEVKGHQGASHVIIKPASQGTGVIACPTVGAVLTAAGIRDVLTKSLGSNTAINLARATLNGLRTLKNPEEIARYRNKKIEDILPSKR